MNRKILLFVLFSLFGVFGGMQTFAQSLPGGLYNGVTVNNQWFANQERKSTKYTQNQCLANGGVWKNQRFYLNSDSDNNGLKDYNPSGNAYYLKDNLQYSGNPSTNRRLALILSKGTSVEGGQSIGSTVYYYTPSGFSNMLSVFANSTTYPIDTNRARYRYSKVAPINQPVRAITSEAVLFEQPSGELNPLERMVQVAYQIRYATYRSVNNNGSSDYQVFPVANMDDFSALGPNDSWYIKNPIQHNNGLGPLWNSDYLHTSSKITTKAINRGPENTHGLECINYYLSRCGDGFIDKTGQQPINGSSTQPYTITDSGVNELCDPGANLGSWTDDVMPGGVPANANYYCTPTCTIVDTPVNPPSLGIDKQQKLVSDTNFSGIGFGTPSDIGYTSPSAFVFKIIISNTGGDATNVVMKDILPVGFVVDSLPGGCSGITSAGVGIACNIPAGGQITSQSFNLPAGQIVTFTIKGTLTSTTPTVNKASASYTDPTTGTTKNTLIDTVNQHPIIPVNPPSLGIDKQQKLYEAGPLQTPFSGIGFGTPSDIGYTSPSIFLFKIIITNTGGDATNVVMKDILPVGFVVDSLPGGCSGITSVGANIVCNAPAGGQITSQSFNLPAGKNATFIIKGTLTSTTPTVNKASASYVDPTTGTPKQTGIDTVNQHPETQANPPSLSIDKQQKLITSTVFSGVGFGTPSDIGYTSPSAFEFKIIITNTGGNATNVVMKDVLPVGFVVDSLPGGCSGMTSLGASIACNPAALGQITSQSFNLPAGNTATFTIKGTLTSTTPTVNKASASYKDPTTGITKQTGIDTVNQHPINEQLPPKLTIDKQQKLIGSTVFSGVGFGTPSDIAYTSPSVFEFKIIITNEEGDATNVVMKDVLPAGFVVASLPGGCSGMTSAGVSIACTASSLGQISSQSFNLPGGQSATFIIKGTLTNTVPTVNKASASYKDPATGITYQTLVDTVNQHPEAGALADLIIKKYAKTISITGDSDSTPVTIEPGEAFNYYYIFENTNNIPINNVTIADTFPPDYISWSPTLPITVIDSEGNDVTSDWIIIKSMVGNSISIRLTKKTPLPANSGKYTVTLPVVLSQNVPDNTILRNLVYICGDNVNNPQGPNGENVCEDQPPVPPQDCTPEDNPNKDPACITPTKGKIGLIYTKKVRNVTTNSNNGQFVEADNLLEAVEVHTGDMVEYQITIKKTEGIAINTILQDILPINNGFIMSGFSINSLLQMPATSFPVTNITSMINNGGVIVTLYGYVGNPTATQFVNTALLTENGIPVATELPGSNVAWTHLPTVVKNSKLRLEKYWINPANSTETGDYYVVAPNTPIKFILRVTNIGNVAAGGIVVDNCPTHLTCLSYRILPSTVSVAYSSTIPVGTVPVAGYVEVEVSAIAYPTASTSPIKNIAKLYRICTLEEDISDGVRDGLCHENDDNADLDPLSSSCGDGTLDIRSGEQCDLGQNMPGTIGRYLDSTTNYPSGTNRGNICTAECKIQPTQASYCGDGKVGRLEQCDMGDGINLYNGGTIGSYLDNIGRSLPSGQYAGQRCSTNCTIDGDNQPGIPACRYTDTIISVMKDEILPFSQDIEMGGENIVQEANQCANNEGALIENSLKCTFEIYNRNEEASNGVSRVIVDAQGCDIDQRGDHKLFMEFYGTQGDDLFVEKPRGTYYLTANEMKAMVGNSLGEYKISLSRVDYQYCKDGRAVTGNPYARVCQVNLAVTDHYLMQKGSVATQTNTRLDNYFLLDGQSLYKATDLNKVDQLVNLNYANLSSSMKTLTDSLIAKYEKIAVSASIGGTTAKKVPGQSIYIVDGNNTFNGSNLTVPTTIIVKGNITIVGNINKNVLIIAKGTVKFDLPQPTDRRNGCEAQTIHGIIVAQKGFVESSNKGFKNINLNQARCRQGNLMVYGALVGDNLNLVVNSRRSHLEGWFTFKQNGSVLGNNSGQERVKAKRRKDVYEGASVYIEQNPSLWRNIPPGADEFLRTLNISRN